jgi:hypothetical protein
MDSIRDTPLFASFGYAVVERSEIALVGDLSLPVVRMAKRTERGALTV